MIGRKLVQKKKPNKKQTKRKKGAAVPCMCMQHADGYLNSFVCEWNEDVCGWKEET